LVWYAKVTNIDANGRWFEPAQNPKNEKQNLKIKKLKNTKKKKRCASPGAPQFESWKTGISRRGKVGVVCVSRDEALRARAARLPIATRVPLRARPQFRNGVRGSKGHSRLEGHSRLARQDFDHFPRLGVFNGAKRIVAIIRAHVPSADGRIAKELVE
jgi:hypothetical protein